MVNGIGLRLRFSESYEKFNEDSFGKQATLVFVEKIDIAKQTSALKAYDSKIRNENRYYPLAPTGEHLFLLFNCEGTLFPTIRPFNEQKEKYYRAAIGKNFLLEKAETKKYKPRETNKTFPNARAGVEFPQGE